MKNKNILFYAYYLLLILALVSRQSGDAAPSMTLRLAFMAAAILPSFFTRKVCYPAIITMLFSITISGFAYSFMPYTLSIYVVITLVIMVLFYGRAIFTAIPVFFILFAIYTFLIDFLFGTLELGAPLFQNMFFCFVLLTSFLVLCKYNTNIALSQFPLCFAVVSIVLSVAFLTHREQFIFMEIGDMDRTGWTDPNYFGMLLGMGIIVSLTKIFSEEWKVSPFFEKIIYISAIVITIPTIVLNASRGSIVSLLVSVLMLLLLSKAKLGLKVFSVLIAVAAVVYMFNNQYFEILEYRVMNDEGTGSGRTSIWASKITAFIEGNPLKIIFGYGHEGGANISGYYIGFHNDYIGFLVDYGLVGFSLLLYMLYFPLRNVSKVSPERSNTVVLVTYLSVCLLTLEPLLTGVLAYFSFYAYALLLSKKEVTINTIKSQK